MLRSVLGVVAGAVLWMVLFTVLAIGLANFWPDYAVHGREYLRQGIFTFTAPMAVCNLVFWVVAELAAGWVAMKIAQRREAVWVLAGLVVAYVGVIHLVTDWSRFPWWYNLGVVIPAGFAVLLGGRMARPAVH
jgi:hypothetical protein